VTSNIFISYRREDAAAYAGRVCDHLGEMLGPNRVFMDVETITPGQNFSQAIDQTINGCQTMLVIIGPKWKTVLLERMTTEHEDYVRHEIESALARKVKVVPVLVGGAAAAELSDLPPALAEISFHQAIELRDNSFKPDCDRLAQSLGVLRARRWRMPVLAVTALIVVAALSIPLVRWMQLRNAVSQLVITSNTQIKLGEYEAAYRTGVQAVKVDPASESARNQEADAAMRWLEHYSIVGGEGTNIAEIAAGQLAEMLSVLDAAFSRISDKGPRAADILAHIGWAHWLNQHIAEKEFGSLAEDSLRQAIRIDPSNVYANAMLGNWLLQKNSSFDEAMKCFSVALATGRERPLVRSMELGGLLYNDAPGAPVQVIKALNDMRQNNERLEDRYRTRFLSVDFDPTNSDEYLGSLLSAVPPDDAWKTYLWLDSGTTSQSQQIKRDFIHATLLELQGRKAEARAAFIDLKTRLAKVQMDGRISEHVSDALKRLQ
jgi:tetratricopeptide (TPR) repeat protein